MSPRDALTAILLGALGIAAAAAIAVFANGITGEEIGLASEPVSVIPADARSRPAPAPGPRREGDGGAESAEPGDDGGISGNTGPGGGDDSGPGGGDDSGPGGGDDSGGAGAEGEIEREKGDDGGGSSGPGSSGSGSSGSGSSGPGSSGSGSSDSGSSGSGDDSPESPDD